ncbi:MAG: glycosyltransferase family 1 protein [Bacteroidota bacterium]
MKVLFIIPYPEGTAPSQRFRFEHYFKELEAQGHSYTVSSFMGPNTWRILYQPGHNLLKASGIIKGYFRRLRDLFRVHKYDYVFIHREASPLGPPVFEWMIARLWKKKIIYDFDDAIWIPNASEHNPIVYRLKRYKNTEDIIRWSDTVSCGNPFLVDFASGFTKHAVFNPTVIDTSYYLPKPASAKNGKFVIGWTGSHSTLQYLNRILPVIQKLEKEFEFEFHVISDKAPSFTTKSLVYKKWNKATEITDLQQFDIGLMPLTNDKWAKGKCGFKALQYLALEIPALVSPVGINTSIVTDGMNGYYCSEEIEWEVAIRKLYLDKNLINVLKKNARKIVEEKFSVNAHRKTFMQLFR